MARVRTLRTALNRLSRKRPQVIYALQHRPQTVSLIPFLANIRFLCALETANLGLRKIGTLQFHVRRRTLLPLPTRTMFITNYGELRNGEPVDSNGLLSVKRAMLFPIRDGRLMRSTFARRRILSFGSAICCPSVAFNLRYLQQPIFESTMKCDLDWQAWEKISRQKGAFYYDSRILMRHRIHEESETTHLIEDNTRGREDLEMLGRFWPSCVARLIYRAYSTSQRSNG